MRRILFVALLFVGAGCQGLPVRRGDSSSDSCDANGNAICRDRPKLFKRPCCDEPECKPAKVEAKKPEPVATPETKPEVAAPPAIAQDVLLVPKMVYIPYVAQTPTTPVRMSTGTPAPPVESPPPAKPPVTSPPPEDKTKRELEQKCLELCDRVMQLEKRLRERDACPPTVILECPPPKVVAPVCPPSTPILNFFRRPLLQRCDPLQPCEPICDTPAPAPRESIQLPKGAQIGLTSTWID